MRRRPRPLVLLPLVGLLLAGCGGDDTTATTPTTTDEAVATTEPVDETPVDEADSGEPDSGGDSAVAEPATVTATNFAFDTEEIVAPSGATIEFTVAEGSHSLTSEEAGFDTGVLSDDTVTVTVDGAPGTYTYRCTLHGQMTGEITITE